MENSSCITNAKKTNLFASPVIADRQKMVILSTLLSSSLSIHTALILKLNILALKVFGGFQCSLFFKSICTCLTDIKFGIYHMHTQNCI